MYEIWLMLNIVWEIALGLWPVLLAAALLWAMLMLAARRRPAGRWRAGLPLALGVGVVVMAVAVPLIPTWTGSTLSDMGYWVDWAGLLGLAAGLGVVAGAFAWPLASMRQRPPQR